MQAQVIKTIKMKANELFGFASFLSMIKHQQDYELALELMDHLMDDYEANRSLITLLSISIHQWEEQSDEFAEFNKAIANIDSDQAILKLLMEQYDLGISDFPEIGSKSLVSKIVNNQRNLTKKHVAALSERFGLDPAVFF